MKLNLDEKALMSEMRKFDKETNGMKIIAYACWIALEQSKFVEGSKNFSQTLESLKQKGLVDFNGEIGRYGLVELTNAGKNYQF